MDARANCVWEHLIVRIVWCHNDIDKGVTGVAMQSRILLKRARLQRIRQPREMTKSNDDLW